MYEQQFHVRLRIVYGIIIVVVLLLIYKLIHLQLIDGDRYYELANQQYTGIADSFLDRGSIYFVKKDGERVSAATVQTGYRVYINPAELNKTENIKHVQEIYNQLNSVLHVDYEKFNRALNKKSDPYEEIAVRVDEATVTKLRELDLAGVGFTRDQWRYYPGDALAAQTIGFVGSSSDDDALVGRYGLEKYYEDILQRDKKDLSVNFFAQIFTDLGETVGNPDTREGDIVTTLEPHVQRFVESTLQDAVERWRAVGGGAIIIDPQSGAIRAMSTLPNFNSNNLRDVADAKVFSNPLIQGTFEMGSIIKPLVMAMGIDTGAVTSETTYYDAGSIVVGDRTINNFDKKARGTVTMTEVLKQSLNTGMVYISQHMKRKDMKEYFTRLGMRTTTGIDMPYEVSGITSNLDTNREVEYANISFGQGIAFSPIQTVRALSSLAFGGKLLEPYLVEKIDYENGFSKKVEHPEPLQVFKPTSVEQVTRMLVALVDTSFKSKYPQLEPYSIAAKTGTAQIANPAGGYYSDRNLHSFFGYFPAYDPEYLIFFYLAQPQGVRYSSETLSQPFMETVQFLANYYDILPDRVNVE